MGSHTHRKYTFYDTASIPVEFDEIVVDNNVIRTAWVSNVVAREIPLLDIFSTFGNETVVMKVEFQSQINACRLSVIDSRTYSHAVHDKTVKSVTYGDVTRVVANHAGAVDAILCASYTDNGALTVEPLVVSIPWLPRWMTVFKVLMFVCLTVVISIYFQDSQMKDFALIAAQVMNTIMSLVWGVF
ncbi:hypothetical protein ElyMa_003966100 [Elysia marginata]|uniref:Transmembrane protein n=1 Tax=Elysia marginata TaxID=1093978 RepID=A0AAV4FYH1_9GAST|nr:hypothetical protein ElyMa_003966100 [Elysia marginata]